MVLTFYSLKVSLERWKRKKNVPLVPTEFSSLVSYEPECQTKDGPRSLLLLRKEISIRTLLHNLAQKPSLYVYNLSLPAKPIPVKVTTVLKITLRIISPFSAALPFLNRRNIISLFFLLVIFLGYVHLSLVDEGKALNYCTSLHSIKNCHIMAVTSPVFLYKAVSFS